MNAKKVNTVVSDTKVDNKQVIVTFNELTNNPIIEFFGSWTGKDIPLVQRLLPKAYYNFKREIRRQGVTK